MKSADNFTPATAATRRIDAITNVLLIAIVLIPFVLSATSLAGLAQANGQQPAFLYPVMVDGGLIIFKLLVLRAALRGRRDLYAWSLAITATAISVGLNVIHAGSEATAVGRFMSALPPLAILAAFVAVTRRIEETAVEQGLVDGIERLKAKAAAEQAKAAKLAAEAEAKATQEAAEAEANLKRLAAQAERLAVQIAALKEDKAQAKAEFQAANREASAANMQAIKAKEEAAAADKLAETAAAKAAKVTAATRPNVAGDPAKPGEFTDRQTAVLSLLKAGQSQAEIATSLQVSERTVRREVAALNGAVAAAKG